MPCLAATYEQSCAYCHQAFIPVKRGTQRFCSSSCRTTHCKKKKAGTLGRLTKLKGPGLGASGAPPSFAEMTLAAGAGALAANAFTQGTEYYVVTKGLVEQVAQLTAQVQQLQAAQKASEDRQEANVRLLGRGILTLLTRLGATEAEAWAALHTPFARPAPTGEPSELPLPAQAPLPASVPTAGTTPLPPAEPRVRAVPAPRGPAPSVRPPTPATAAEGGSATGGS